MASARLDHLHIRSKDPEASASFYVECFGAWLTDRSKNPGDSRYVVSFDDFRIFIDRTARDAASDSAEIAIGLEHIAIRTDEWDRVVERLKERGVVFVRELPPTPEMRAVFVLAPDNVLIEVIERTPK